MGQQAVAPPSKEHLLNLVKQAQAGERAAFDELYQHYLTPLYRYIYFRVSSQAEAEDLTQTVFLKAWKKLDSFQFQGYSFSAWLYQIARHTLIDYYRRHKNIAPSQPLENYSNLPDERQADQDERIDQQQKLDLLKQLIQTLNASQREILILKFINDLTTQEIAQQLNKSATAVRALQYRALKSLKLKLKDSNFNF